MGQEAGEESLPAFWLEDTLTIPMDGDTIIAFNLAKNVHTPSDVMVYLKGQKLLFGGTVSNRFKISRCK
jgi:glyoxylase-like metal-dependent hydrolase (beta-lactamase superfamily II)